MTPRPTSAREAPGNPWNRLRYAVLAPVDDAAVARTLGPLLRTGGLAAVHDEPAGPRRLSQIALATGMGEGVAGT